MIASDGSACNRALVLLDFVASWAADRGVFAAEIQLRKGIEGVPVRGRRRAAAITREDHLRRTDPLPAVARGKAGS